MGLSRNKVAVPEGAAGTPPFWRDALEEENLEDLEALDNLENLENLEDLGNLDPTSETESRPRGLATPDCFSYWLSHDSEKGDAEVASHPGQAARRSPPSRASPRAQLVRAPH